MRFAFNINGDKYSDLEELASYKEKILSTIKKSSQSDIMPNIVLSYLINESVTNTLLIGCNSYQINTPDFSKEAVFDGFKTLLKDGLIYFIILDNKSRKKAKHPYELLHGDVISNLDDFKNYLNKDMIGKDFLLDVVVVPRAEVLERFGFNYSANDLSLMKSLGEPEKPTDYNHSI